MDSLPHPRLPLALQPTRVLSPSWLQSSDVTLEAEDEHRLFPEVGAAWREVELGNRMH